MDRSMRIFVLLILVVSWTGSLFTTANPARAQALDNANMNNGFHVVESGETLNKIARLYGTDVKTLQQLNNLDNVDLLYVGQRLLISEGESWNQPAYEEQAPWENVDSYATPQERGRQTGEEVRRNVPAPGEVSWSEAYSEGYEETEAYAQEEEQQEEVEPEAHVQQQPYVPQGQSYAPQGSRPGQSYEPEGSAQGQAHAPDRSEQGGSYPPESGALGWSYPAEGAEQGWSYAQEEPVQGRSYEPLPEKALTGEKWVDIDLGNQQLIAYQGDSAVRFFWISSGGSSTPTVTGSFRTYSRTPLQDMSGGSKAADDYYFQADVPWVQYFFEDYALHGAYWHNSFGQPRGHGCVNMRVEEAQWLYEWTGATGIRVEVHE